MQCAQRLEALYAKNPQLPGLRENLAQILSNYAANIKDYTFENRKKAVEASLRSLELQPDAPAELLDKRTTWLYVHALMASIDAGNSSGTRQQRYEARELLRYTASDQGKSGSKLHSAVMTWRVYRHMGFGPVKSTLCFCSYALHGVWKHYLG